MRWGARLVWVATICLGGMYAPAAASAQQRVVLVQYEGEPRTGFADMLRVQLAVSGVELAEVNGGALQSAARSRRAAELAREHRAQLAVWMERRGDALIVRLVDLRWRERTLSADDPDDPEVDRYLAIKVDEVVGQDATALEEPRAAPAPEEAPATNESITLYWIITTGASAVTGSGTLGPRVGADASTGVGAASGAWGGELRVGGRWLPADTTQNAAGSLEIAEWDAGVIAHGWHDLSTLRLGISAGIALRVLDASGRSVAGSTGDTTRVIPDATAAIQARIPLASDVLHLGASVGVDVALRDQRFTINGEPVADVGRARGSAAVFVVMTVP